MARRSNVSLRRAAALRATAALCEYARFLADGFSGSMLARAWRRPADTHSDARRSWRAVREFDGARPVTSLLEVVRQFGHNVLYPPLVHRGQTLADLAMKPGSARR